MKKVRSEKQPMFYGLTDRNCQMHGSNWKVLDDRQQEEVPNGILPSVSRAFWVQLFGRMTTFPKHSADQGRREVTRQEDDPAEKMLTSSRCFL